MFFNQRVAGLKMNSKSQCVQGERPLYSILKALVYSWSDYLCIHFSFRFIYLSHSMLLMADQPKVKYLFTIILIRNGIKD